MQKVIKQLSKKLSVKQIKILKMGVIMNKKLKKLMLIIIVVAVTIFTYMIKMDLKQQAKAKKYSIAYHKSLSREDQLRSILKNNADLAEHYGGSYIDKDNNLNVNIVGEENLQKLIKLLDNESIICHNVKFSYNELIKSIELLKDNLENYNIKFIGFNSKENCLDIYLTELNDVYKEKINNLVNKDMNKYYKNNDNFKLYVDALREYSENVLPKTKSD